MKNNKPVICITDGKEFKSITDAAIWYRVNPVNIAANCKGKTKTCNGQVFKFKA